MLEHTLFNGSKPEATGNCAEMSGGRGAAEQPPSADKPQREPIRWWWTLSKDGRLSLAILSQLRLTTCCVPCQSLARLAVPVRFLGCTRTFMICTLNSCLVS